MMKMFEPVLMAVMVIGSIQATRAEEGVLIIGGEGVGVSVGGAVSVFPPTCLAGGPPPPLPFSLASASVLHYTVLACGGRDHRTEEAIADCVTYSLTDGDRWRYTSPLEHARYAHTMTTVGESVVAIGGNGHFDLVGNLVEVYENQAWTTRPDMEPSFGFSLGLTDHCATAVSDSELVMLSYGYNGKLNIRTGHWKDIPEMITRRGGTGCTYFRGGVLVAGGSPPNFFTSLDTVEYLDLVSNKWEEYPALNTKRQGLSLSLLNSFPTAIGDVNTTEVLIDGLWQLGETVGEVRRGHSAVVLNCA